MPTWGGDFSWWMILVGALALAVFSFTVAFGLVNAPGKNHPVPDSERPKKFAVLGVATALGCLAAIASPWGLDGIPLGVLVGLGIVELVPYVFNRFRKKVDGE